MQKYKCDPCGYIYDPAVGDPDNGIAPGTPFEALPCSGKLLLDTKGVVFVQTMVY